MNAKLSVVLPYWLDRPALEALEIARTADRLGYAGLWVGEMMTFDAFALAAAIVRETKTLGLTLGPLAVTLRTPAMLALGMASIVELGGRPAGLALGASTPVVVSQWHGRPWDAPIRRMRETVDALRPMLAGEKSSHAGRFVRSSGFRTATPAARSPITIAAFGPQMTALAARLADRVVVNLVTVAQVARTKQAILRAAAAADREAPPLAVWLPVALEPSSGAWQQIARQLVVYLAPPGYGEMFREAGFGELVDRARAGTHPRELMEAMPRGLAEAIGAIGSPARLRERFAEYAAAGADEIGIVPVTAGDAGAATLLASLASH